MYNGIGLQTARGSGTNGYVQTNKFFIRSRTGKVAPTTRGFEGDQGTGGITKKPNSDILEHDRKRQIELKLVVLEDKLIDQGFTDAEIAEKVEEARNTLEAAAASEEHGGHGAFMLGDSKVSDTQSHQIAARKEKQMETLRAALGIAKTSEADEQHADMSEDGLKNGGKWDQKPEHSFLDRDISWKKSMVEDPKGERDDKKKGVKNLKNKKKEDGANDTKRSKKNEYRQRKGRRTADDTGSDSDHVKKKKLKKHKKSRRDSDSDDSSMEDDTDSDSGKRKSKTSKNRRKSKRYSSDSYDSSTEDEKYKKPHKRHDSDDSDTGKPHLKQAVEKFHKSSRRHDSDDSDTDKPRLKQAVENIQKSSRRHDSDDSDTDKPHLKQVAEKIHKSSRRHDSDDSDADKPHLLVVERIHKSSRRHDSDDDDTGHLGGNCPTKVPDYDVDDRWKGDEVHMKSSPKYIGRGKSDKERKLSKELTDESKKRDHSGDFNVRKSEKGRGRRHASDDDGDDSDTSYGRISLKKKMGRHAIERKLDSSSDDGNSSEFLKGSSSNDSGSSDSDHSHGKAVKKDPVGGDGAKNTGGRSAREEKSLKSAVAGADDRRRQRNGLGDDLHNSRGDAVDTSGYSSRAMMSSKRKLDDAVKEEQEESKSRNRNVGEESGRNRDRWLERDESGSKTTRSYQSKNDQRKDDYSKSVKPKGRGDEDVDFKDRTHHKDDEHGSKNYSAHEKNAVEKKLSKGEGDQKGRNYERYEEGGDQHRRHGKDDWNQQQTSGKLGLGEDEQREGKGHEREKRITRDADLGERRYQRDEEGGDVYKKSGKDGDQERGSHRRGRGEDEHRGSRSLEREKQITRDEDDQGRRRYERDQEGGGVYKRSGKHDGDQERGSHRRVRGEDEQRGSRGLGREKHITRDGDDQGERRYQRDEEGGDANKRSGKDDGAQERGRHKRGRGEEEARGDRGYNRDKEVDYSKKGRYDDHRSSERKRYERD